MAAKTSTRYTARRKKLFALLKKYELESLCVSSAVNIRYLTGFHCSFGRVLACGGRVTLFTDSRYTFAARRAGGFDVVETNGLHIDRDIKAALRDAGVKRMGVEQDHITHAEYLATRKAMRGVRLEPVAGFVEKLRMVKDADEIQAVRRACRIGDKAFKHICGIIEPGLTERRVAAELNAYMMSQQVDGLAFDSIVASGPRGAFAHAVPSRAKIKKGDLVVLDFGVCLDGYHSDMTRTVAAGKPAAELLRMYEAVQRAQAAALDCVRAGVSVRTPDQAARRELKKFDLEQYFTHGLGHGVGLDVHEIPRLSPVGGERLRAGAVVTVEPGVYVDGLGGVRIEDTVAVTRAGADILTRSSKKLVVL